jgi:hypothetical protein
MLLFATWCTAAGRQRINANGFSTPYDYSPERKTQCQNQFSNHNYIIPSILFRKSLCLFMPILLHHVWLVRSCSSLPMLSLPLLSTDCLSFLPPEGRGPPSPPSPEMTPFPSGPRQQPASVLGTVCPYPFNRTQLLNLQSLEVLTFQSFLVYPKNSYLFSTSQR